MAILPPTLNRRQMIRTSLAATVASAFPQSLVAAGPGRASPPPGFPMGLGEAYPQYPFTLPALPYPTDALEAAVDECCSVTIPLPEYSRALDLRRLVSVPQETTRLINAYRTYPRGCLIRLSRVNQLPDLSSRFRYVFYLFFPRPENMRYRYRLAPERAVWPFYFYHLFIRSARFLVSCLLSLRKSG